MDGQNEQPNERSFVIHLWLEGKGWRGHVTDGRDEHWFEHGQSLIDFITERLRLSHGVSLPSRRADQ